MSFSLENTYRWNLGDPVPDVEGGTRVYQMTARPFTTENGGTGLTFELLWVTYPTSVHRDHTSLSRMSVYERELYDHPDASLAHIVRGLALREITGGSADNLVWYVFWRLVVMGDDAAPAWLSEESARGWWAEHGKQWLAQLREETSPED